MFTAHTYTHDNIIKSYFESWKHYDNALLERIFHKNATYKIKPKNRSLKGHDQLLKYWTRNKNRQRNIRLKWDILNRNIYTYKVSFEAKFYDFEERENQKVEGVINFSFYKKKVIRLTEQYKKSGTKTCGEK